MTEPRKDPNEDRILDHEYDGIREYDNPMPRWWVMLFWATIVFAVVYFLNVIPGIGSGRGRIANYEREMAAARARYAAVEREQQQRQPVLTDASLMALAKDPAALAAGKQTFTNTCAPCHRPDGGGNIGPNLTDDYWIHGGTPMEIVHTITAGVPDKGMPTWGQTLNPEQIERVAAYVISLHGTNPPNPKAPQGVKTEAAAGTGK